MHPKDISIQDYTYTLPDEKIALFPLEKRDQSKLLVYDGAIQQDQYVNIAEYLPENAFLVFNNTKVLQARMLFQKPTGGVIEIFCLEPHEAINDYATVLSKTKSVQWKCLIGGLSKWKDRSLLKPLHINGKNIILTAVHLEALSDAHVVEFSWDDESISFAEILSCSGEVPLPPYIKRKADVEDKTRYQTVYAKHEGSVAAPTAGLHFTNAVLESLSQKNIGQGFVTLHVGAGTFKPVKAEKMEQHEMHHEWIDVDALVIRQILDNTEKFIVATGTTSLRTIESLYWMGVKVLLDENIQPGHLHLHQWEVYEAPLATQNHTVVVALTALLEWMKKNQLQKLFAQTGILIAPGYQFRVARALITNFHQPQSTLLLLIAAIVGKEWKHIYQYAMQNDFRFLSYGDGSLLFMPDAVRAEL